MGDIRAALVAPDGATRTVTDLPDTAWLTSATDHLPTDTAPGSVAVVWCAAGAMGDPGRRYQFDGARWTEVA